MIRMGWLGLIQNGKQQQQQRTKPITLTPLNFKVWEN